MRQGWALMSKALMSALLGKKKRTPQASRQRIFLKHRPAVTYAIGDIHGCHQLLMKLERQIFDDAASIDGVKLLVCLGDYVDRGPASASVLDHLRSPLPPGFWRICLAGNHEQMALDFLGGTRDNGWLDFGGRETLSSYGIVEMEKQPERFAAQLSSHVPEDHVAFLGSLPTMLTMPGFVFVHAGVDPGRTLEDQEDEVLLWSRPKDFPWPAGGTGYRVIHGHTPVKAPDLAADRIDVDLGAYATGRLCAVKLTRGGEMSTLVAV